MIVPAWTAIVVGALVFGYGAFRVVTALRPVGEDERRRGLYGLVRRRGAIMGIVQMILATLLILSAFGIRPFF
jgi:hypothetical protein